MSESFLNDDSHCQLDNNNLIFTLYLVLCNIVHTCTLLLGEESSALSQEQLVEEIFEKMWRLVYRLFSLMFFQNRQLMLAHSYVHTSFF